MCGRYTLTVEQDDLEARFDAQFRGGDSGSGHVTGSESGSEFTPRYNMAPGQELPVITDEDPTMIRRLEWGLVPSWADDDTGGLINARAESVDEKPSFRGAYERPSGSRDPSEGPDTSSAGRCLVPADGFYEWVETEDGKRPYRVTFEDDRVFAMAGLWERWEPETTQTGLDAFGGGIDDEIEAEPLETYTILTTEPNDLVSDLHNRMAVIVDPGDEERWLSAADPQELFEPYPADGMCTAPVSMAVNNPSTDDPSILEPS
ncbi:SOS response-associated peptidase [Natrinema halophilum]|uniref:SOS response-associated peptidase n=1 Tax=Natrinema halophilum TaxID=1699371 RepID=A0A7D5GN58_9EURY|nr:SOS response-associated peptidase [Natrinema halophilum]QLG49113.1 SOS response-associated peptidase [Natrinema halophilum]